MLWITRNGSGEQLRLLMGLGLKISGVDCVSFIEGILAEGTSAEAHRHAVYSAWPCGLGVCSETLARF